MKIQYLRRLFSFILIIFLYLSSTGCSQDEKQPLRIASSPWPGFEPLYLARDLGYLDKNKTKLFELPSLDITMESFRNRSADLATLTLDEVLELLLYGTKLRILLIMDISNGGDAVLAKPEIKNIEEIKGKRISIVNVPLGLYMLNRMLDKAGLKRQDVKVFPMPDTQQEKFYQAGNADVVVTYDPVKSRLQKAGLNVIFDSSDIPNEIFDLLVVHEDVYQSRKKELCELGSNWFKTLEYIKNNKDATRRMGQRLAVSTEEFDKMMQGLKVPTKDEHKNLLIGENPLLIVAAKKFSRILMHEKHFAENVDASVAIDKDFLACLK